MHELSFGITNDNKTFGPARNPWNQALISGGSSGGVAVSVAANLMLGGIGTDTGASVRLPAALCGVVGFRPTFGNYPTDGIVPVSPSRDTPGLIVRSVEDAVLLDRIIRNKCPTQNMSLKGLRLGLPRSHFFDNLEPHVAAASERAIRRLATNQMTFVEADIPNVAELTRKVSLPVAIYEFPRALMAYLSFHGIGNTFDELIQNIQDPQVYDLVQSQLSKGLISESVYRRALRCYKPRLKATYENYYSSNGLDAVLFPSVPLTAKPVGLQTTLVHNGVETDTFGIFVRNLDPSSNIGLPSLSVPVSLTPDRLPVGIQIEGPFGSDDMVLAIGRAVEEMVKFGQEY
ncbi:hypothetical protein RvVAT039_pl09870 (plasmid) [Agrobacterium vitis]|nr:hypothetical protein RvVAT039_pl09870 [Agrobacterium vitis]